MLRVRDHHPCRARRDSTQETITFEGTARIRRVGRLKKNRSAPSSLLFSRVGLWEADLQRRVRSEGCSTLPRASRSKHIAGRTSKLPGAAADAADPGKRSRPRALRRRRIEHRHVTDREGAVRRRERRNTTDDQPSSRVTRNWLECERLEEERSVKPVVTLDAIACCAETDRARAIRSGRKQHGVVLGIDRSTLWCGRRRRCRVEQESNSNEGGDHARGAVPDLW
jgi:hypothetical protein